MIIVVDESVSYGIVPLLREAGHEVVAIAESATTGIGDEQVFHLVQERGALLISRDYHFTNAIRFPASATRGILYIRRGNLTAQKKLLSSSASLHSIPPTHSSVNSLRSTKTESKFDRIHCPSSSLTSPSPALLESGHGGVRRSSPSPHPIQPPRRRESD
jgi:predicted nuclease of predicted toxin-antitoxin system